MSSKITIDLSELDSTSPLNADKLIFRDKYDSLLRRIKDSLDDNIQHDKEEQGKKSYEPKQTPFFFINGDRGSGKSTLLRAVRNKLLSHNEFDGFKIPYNIQLLAEVDPTIMAPSENFFILVLSCICKSLNEKEHLKEHKRALYQKAIRLIQEMSTGLKLLVSSDTYLQKIAESETFIEDSVEQCTSSSELKRKFGELIDTLCDITATDAFLITIDDADMSFKKSYEILEYTRTYMRTPRLLFIFAGDMNHYSLVIRGKQLEGFGSTALEHDEEMAEHRNQLLASIGEQYLLKFFPVGHLISLSNFGELLQKADSVLILAHTLPNGKGGEQQTLKKLLTPYFSVFSSPKYATSIHDFFAGLPIRTAFQLLKSLEFPQENAQQEAQNVLNTFTEGIMAVSSHALILHQIDFKSIHNGNFKTLLKTVFSHIRNLGYGYDIPRLLPNTGNNSQKMVSLYLTAEIAKGLSIHQMLTYIGSIFPHLELSIAQNEMRTRRYPRYYRNADDNRAYLYNITIEFSEQLGEQATACIAESLKTNAKIKSYGKGIVPILLQEVSRKSSGSTQPRLSLVEYITSVTTLPDIGKEKNDILFILGIYHSLILTANNKTSRYCLSLYKLLACAEHILKICHSEKAEAQSDGSSLREKIKEILLPNYYHSEETDIDTDNFASTFINAELADKLLSIIRGKKHDEQFNHIVNEVCSWAEKYCSVIEQTSPAEFNDAWLSYMKICNKLTEQAVINAMHNDNMYPAGDLYVSYMAAFIEAAKANMKTECRLCNCLEQFPLWEALIYGKENTTPLFELTCKLSTVTAETTGEVSLERIRLNHVNYTIESLNEQRLNISKAISIEKDSKFISETAYKQQNEEVVRLKENNIKESKQIREIYEELNKKNEEIKEINNLIDELNKRLTDSKARLEIRERYFQDSEAKHEKVRQAIITSKNKIDVLESQLTSLRKLNDSKTSGKTLYSLHNIIKNNSELIQKEKAALSEAEGEASRHEMYKSSLSLRLDRMRQDIAELTQQLEEKQTVLKEKSEERNIIKSHLTEAERDLKQQQALLNSTQQELAQTRLNIDSCSEKIRSFEAKLYTIEQDLDKAQNQRRFIENNLRSLTDD